jgi:hypothetical protein
MALIFVHGVNNRSEDPDYEARRLLTAKFFERYLRGAVINGKSLAEPHAEFPYWGDLATKFRWNMRSLPSGEMDALGANVDPNLRPLIAVVRDALDDSPEASEQPLLTVARRSFPRAVELTAELVLQENMPAVNAEERALFAIEAQLYASDFEPPKPPPAWLAGLTTDAQFCNQLLQAIKSRSQAGPGPQALGGISSKISGLVTAGATRLKQATQQVAETILDRTGDFASTKVLAWNRHSLNANLGRFFGDVFIYMDKRGQQGQPGPIPSRLLQAWDQAIAATPDEPVVIVGHSLGGVISFDLLSHFAQDRVVDLFVSVGSQVAHFEEMKLYKASRDDIPGAGGDKVAKPSNIKHWINVFDEVDIFSYSCKAVFDQVHDYPYDTKTYVVKAHGAYFEQPRFYERLRARIDTLPVL